MAKASRNRKQKKSLTIKDIVKGNFLNREEIRGNYRYFILIFILMMMMIYSNHLVSQKIETLTHLKEESEEYKSRNAYAQSRLIHIKMESELSKEMEKDSLLPLQSHPIKILIKPEEVNGKKGQ